MHEAVVYETMATAIEICCPDHVSNINCGRTRPGHFVTITLYSACHGAKNLNYLSKKSMRNGISSLQGPPRPVVLCGAARTTPRILLRDGERIWATSRQPWHRQTRHTDNFHRFYSSSSPLLEPASYGIIYVRHPLSIGPPCETGP
jgi:hypothetical protein